MPIFFHALSAARVFSWQTAKTDSDFRKDCLYEDQFGTRGIFSVAHETYEISQQEAWCFWIQNSDIISLQLDTTSIFHLSQSKTRLLPQAPCPSSLPSSLPGKLHPHRCRSGFSRAKISFFINHSEMLSWFSGKNFAVVQCSKNLFFLSKKELATRTHLGVSSQQEFEYCKMRRLRVSSFQISKWN